jgi:putative redox protein
MNDPIDHAVIVEESGNGPYAQFVSVGHHVLGEDEPERFGGHDTGPSPYEYMLAALGGCTAMTLRMYANRYEWQLQKVTVELRHDRSPSLNKGEPVDRFHRTIRLSGDLTNDQRRNLMQIAEQCPVSRTLQRPSEVVTYLADNTAAAMV